MFKSPKKWRAVLVKGVGKQLVAIALCVIVARVMAQKKIPYSTKTPSVTHVLDLVN